MPYSLYQTLRTGSAETKELIRGPQTGVLLCCDVPLFLKVLTPNANDPRSSK